MVDTKLLTFINLCATKSFTKTAEQLYITQPSVTNHIKSLEKYYEIKLFEANDKNFNLTKEGKVLYDYAMQLVAFDASFERLLQTTKAENKKIIFAVTPSVMNGYLKYILPVWSLNHSDLNYQIEELAYPIIEEELFKGKIDFALVDTNFIKRSFVATPLHKTKLVLAVGKTHPFANRSKINFKDLKNERFFIGNQECGKRIFFENELKFKNCDLSDLNYLNEVYDPYVIAEIVAAGAGISLFYESEIEMEVKNGKLIPIELLEIKNAIEFRVIHNKNHLLLPQITKIWEDFRKIYKELNYLRYKL